jgi:adenylosuccinate synthase
MQAFIVVDLGFGDAGKGSLVDYLVRRHHAHTVIRFNGGAQAAHNVVTPDGIHHTFAQFGSGTFVPGVRTHLSRFMLVDPVALLQEERHLRTLGITDAFDRLSIDRNALVVTPFQRAANRLREIARGNDRHGSCGMGIGETMADHLVEPAQVLRMGDLLDRQRTLGKLRALQNRKCREMADLTLPATTAVAREMALLNNTDVTDEFADLFADIAKRVTVVPSSDETLQMPGNVIFEGAQGVLLDEWFGFHPYTTWSTTTFSNALTLLHEHLYPGKITRIGAIRAYMTRHGPGPFPTESKELTHQIPERHNRTNDWQRAFRAGWLDLVLLRYALEITGGVDQLALTCLDQLQMLRQWKICAKYSHHAVDCFDDDCLRVAGSRNLQHQNRLAGGLAACQAIYETIRPQELVGYVEHHLGSHVGIRSFGPTFQNKT